MAERDTGYSQHRWGYSRPHRLRPARTRMLSIQLPPVPCVPNSQHRLLCLTLLPLWFGDLSWGALIAKHLPIPPKGQPTNTSSLPSLSIWITFTMKSVRLSSAGVYWQSGLFHSWAGGWRSGTTIEIHWGRTQIVAQATPTIRSISPPLCT